jgi:hypothetical protein
MWLLTLRGKHRFKVFLEQGGEENIWGKREEVTGGWIKLHNEKLHNLFSSLDLIRVIKSKKVRWAGHTQER